MSGNPNLLSLPGGLWLVLILVFLTASSGESKPSNPSGARPIDFNRDIRPIVVKKLLA